VFKEDQNKSAAKFYMGTLLSSVGSMTFTVSLLAFMLKENFSLFQASLILGASRLIPILISKILGGKADEYSPKTVVLVTEIGTALSSIGILFSWLQGKDSYWLLFLFSVTRAMLMSFQNGSKSRVAREFADENYKSQSRHAIWLNKVTQGATLFAGILGWVAFRFLNFKTVIIFDAITFIINGIILFNLSMHSEPTQSTNKASIFKKFHDLYKFNPRAATLYLVLALVIMGTSSFTARLSGTHQELISLLLISYGLSVMSFVKQRILQNLESRLYLLG
jgi:MFS family permease